MWTNWKRVQKRATKIFRYLGNMVSVERLEGSGLLSLKDTVILLIYIKEENDELFISTEGRTRHNVLKIEEWRLIFSLDTSNFPTT